MRVRSMIPRFALALALAIALALAPVAPASAVIIDSGDGTGNTSAPVPVDPGWHNVGTRSWLTCVYLGGRFVLTASHVPPGDVVLDGQTYRYVPGTVVQLGNGDGTFADLILFQVFPEPPLPALTIRNLPPVIGTPVILVGHGVNRGAATSWNGIDGYEWGAGQSMRWGTNDVSALFRVEIPGTSTWAIQTVFDPAGSDHEAQGAVGDSGGAAFAQNLTQHELAGILFAIGTFPDQPAGTALYGNPTYSVDLSIYRQQILDLIALPEPTWALWPGAALAALLARRRQLRSRSTTRR